MLKLFALLVLVNLGQHVLQLGLQHLQQFLFAVLI